MNLQTWAKTMPHDLILAACLRHKLKPEYVYAICQKESAGRTFATRFERDLYENHLLREAGGRVSYFLRPENYSKLNGTTAHTERVHQMTSWGMMQVCGFKARELGYAEELPKICLPHIGIELGCLALRKFLDRYNGIYRHGILAYNAGSVRPDPLDGRKFVNQAYLDGVLALVAELGHTESTGENT